VKALVPWAIPFLLLAALAAVPSDLPSGAYPAGSEDDAPVAWWRLAEPDDQDTAFAKYGPDGTYYGSPNRSEPGLVVKDDSPSVFFDHTDAGDVNRMEVGTQVLTGYPFTITAVIKIPAQRDDYFRIILTHWFNGTPTDRFTFAVPDDSDPTAYPPGRLAFDFNIAGAGNDRVVHSTSRVDDGSVHHVAVVAASASDIKVYVDGVDQTVVTFNNNPTFPAGFHRIAIGNDPAAPNAPGQFGLDGYIQDVVIYNTALSAARIAAHSSASKTPWAGDTPGQRIARILDLIDWPTGAANRDIATGRSTLQSTTLGGTALAHIQAVEESEGGWFFVEADGTLRFKGRANIHNPASQQIFSDSPAAGEGSYVDLGYSKDEVFIRNDVRISRLDGVSQQVEDAASIEEFGRLSYVLEGLLINSDAESRDRAELVINTYKGPQNRISRLVIDPSADEADIFPHALGRELGDAVTVQRKPQGVGNEISKAYVIEGINHVVTAKTWRTGWSLTPVDPVYGPFALWEPTAAANTRWSSGAKWSY
jgi:hypothetical protein